jgi:hypothetical protein
MVTCCWQLQARDHLPVTQIDAILCCMHGRRCKAEASQLLKTEFGEFTVDNRCWIRTGFSLTQVCTD